MNCLKIIVCFLFGLYFAGLAQASNVSAIATTKAANIRLYALNCGDIHFDDGASFSDTEFYPHKPITLADPCFLIKHDSNWLLWDLGLGDQYVGKVKNAANGITFSATISLVAQLKQLGLTPNDIKYVGLSHTHVDHVGNANLFPHATLLIQRAEYQSIQQNPLPQAVSSDLFKILRPMSKTLLTGDYDVFGDSSVIILSTPGHTVGHQSLQLNLAHVGTVILSGDLYHIRESYRSKQIPAFNANRADSLASMARVDSILQNTHGRLVIQHDPDDFAALPKFPQFLN